MYHLAPNDVPTIQPRMLYHLTLGFVLGMYLEAGESLHQALLYVKFYSTKNIINKTPR